MKTSKIEKEIHVLSHAAKRIGAVSRGEDFESEALRLHRYDRSIGVWDLTNAGKRGKQVDRFSLDMYQNPPGAEDLVEAIQKAKSFSAALALAKKFCEEHPDAKLHEDKARGVDIAPAGFKPISVSGKQCFVHADYDSFTVKDRSDINEETCIPAVRGGKADIKVFYRWVKDNEHKIKDMAFNEIVRGMSEAGIRYHRYCALD